MGFGLIGVGLFSMAYDLGERRGSNLAIEPHRVVKFLQIIVLVSLPRVLRLVLLLVVSEPRNIRKVDPGGREIGVVLGSCSRILYSWFVMIEIELTVTGVFLVVGVSEPVCARVGLQTYLRDCGVRCRELRSYILNLKERRFRLV